MELGHIFKMEMYKNFLDKTYLIIIGIFTVLMTILSLFVFSEDFFFNLVRTQDTLPSLYVFLMILAVFTFLGLLVFAFLYPFHLLNLDYKNKVMSLMFASGVSRTKYYFVKIGATILSCYIVATIILLPLMLSTESARILQFMGENIFAIVQWVVVMMVAIILTKGSTSGLFLFIGLNLGISIVQWIIISSLLPARSLISFVPVASEGWAVDWMSLITIAIFGFIGVFLLRRQDL